MQIKRKYHLLFSIYIVILPSIFGQVDCGNIDSIIQKIIKANYFKEHLYITGMSSEIGIKKDSQYLRYEQLVNCASINKLDQLLKSDNNVMLAFAWKALLIKAPKKALDYLDLNFDNLRTRKVSVFANYCQGMLKSKLSTVLLNELSTWITEKGHKLPAKELVIFNTIKDQLIQSKNSIWGQYQIQSKGKFSTIQLNHDDTFVFKYRTGSSFLRFDRTGTFELNNNIIILKDSFIQTEPYVTSSVKTTQAKNISIQIKDHLGMPLENVVCTFNYLSSGKRKIRKTNNLGEVYFKKNPFVFWKRNKVSFLNLKANINGQEISSSMYIDKKSNDIKFVINLNPKSEKKERRESYKLLLNQLVGFSTNSVDPNMTYKKVIVEQEGF